MNGPTQYRIQALKNSRVQQKGVTEMKKGASFQSAYSEHHYCMIAALFFLTQWIKILIYLTCQKNPCFLSSVFFPFRRETAERQRCLSWNEETILHQSTEMHASALSWKSQPAQLIMMMADLRKKSSKQDNFPNNYDPFF